MPARVVVAEAVERDVDVDGLHVEVLQGRGRGTRAQDAGCDGAAAERDGGQGCEAQAGNACGRGSTARERAAASRRACAPSLEQHEDGRDGQGDRERDQPVTYGLSRAENRCGHECEERP